LKQANKTYVFDVFTPGLIFTIATAHFFFVIVVPAFAFTLIVVVAFTVWVVVTTGFVAAPVARRA
jgi:hypothetical protein